MPQCRANCPSSLVTLLYNYIALHMVNIGIKAENYRDMPLCFYGHRGNMKVQSPDLACFR